MSIDKTYLSLVNDINDSAIQLKPIWATEAGYGPYRAILADPFENPFIDEIRSNISRMPLPNSQAAYISDVLRSFSPDQGEGYENIFNYEGWSEYANADSLDDYSYLENAEIQKLGADAVDNSNLKEYLIHRRNKERYMHLQWQPYKPEITYSSVPLDHEPPENNLRPHNLQPPFTLMPPFEGEEQFMNNLEATILASIEKNGHYFPNMIGYIRDTPEGIISDFEAYVYWREDTLKTIRTICQDFGIDFEKITRRLGITLKGDNADLDDELDESSKCNLKPKAIVLLLHELGVLVPLINSLGANVAAAKVIADLTGKGSGFSTIKGSLSHFAENITGNQQSASQAKHTIYTSENLIDVANYLKTLIEKTNGRPKKGQDSLKNKIKELEQRAGLK